MYKRQGKDQLALPVLTLALGLALVVGIINAVAIVVFRILSLIHISEPTRPY